MKRVAHFAPAVAEIARSKSILSSAKDYHCERKADFDLDDGDTVPAEKLCMDTEEKKETDYVEDVLGISDRYTAERCQRAKPKRPGTQEWLVADILQIIVHIVYAQHKNGRLGADKFVALYDICDRLQKEFKEMPLTTHTRFPNVPYKEFAAIRDMCVRMQTQTQPGSLVVGTAPPRAPLELPHKEIRTAFVPGKSLPYIGDVEEWGRKLHWDDPRVTIGHLDLLRHYATVLIPVMCAPPRAPAGWKWSYGHVPIPIRMAILALKWPTIIHTNPNASCMRYRNISERKRTKRY